MRYIFYFILGIICLNSCIDPRTDSGQKDIQSENTVESDQSKDKKYFEIMKNKNISLILKGDCEDALEDTIHERYNAYIDYGMLTDSTLLVDFKFIDACCQTFMGDYKIKNDTLIFEFEQVNNETCSCICWYKYRLQITDIKVNYKSYIIKGK